MCIRDSLETAFARSDHLPAVVAAMEQAKLSPSALNAVQRTALLEQKNAGLAKRGRALFAALKPVDNAILQRFVNALKAKRDTNAGQAVFNQHCATCHRAHGIGFAVGPDLTAEFRLG
mgnify:CR=1 FL=1